MEQQLQARYQHTRVSQLAPAPPYIASKAQNASLITTLLAFAQLFLLPRPFFKNQNPEVQEYWDKLARDAERKLLLFRNANDEALGLNGERAATLWRHIMGEDNHQRPLTQVSRVCSPKRLKD